MNGATTPSFDVCLNEFLCEEQLLTHTAMEQQKSTSLLVTYVVQGKPKGRQDMNDVQCFCYKDFGHFAWNCPKKFCNYCTKMAK